MKKFAVISHTHWDREWYMPFEEFRLRLVDLIDRLFPIIEAHPDYIFHLDAQTVVLEDYLAIRPENEGKLKAYIASGNIRVGPWYLQNDFYLTSGEATVRNLQIGRKIAKEFGKCGAVGYAPDQFGNVSQLPQILNGFGIDNFIFGRGYKIYKRENGAAKEEFTPAEFIWKGADGSECLAVHLKKWYNNAQRIPENISAAKQLLDENAAFYKERNTSGYVLLMNGVDHLEAQDDLTEILEKLQKEGYDVAQYGLDEYIDGLKKDVENKKLPVYSGALDKGSDYEILKGCWSSRIHLKRANVRAQDLLLAKLEPLYSYLALSLPGCYPHGELDYLWKELLQNHPHDSICGCSVDAVNRHMADRYERIAEMGEALLERGMKLLCHHMAHPLKDDKNYLVAAFNPTLRPMHEAARADLYIPRNEEIGDFSLVDDEGKEIEYELISREQKPFDVFSPLNLPGTIDSDKVTVEFVAEIAPLTARVYAAIPAKGKKCAKKYEGVENDRYKLTFDGGLIIEDKKTGKTHRDPILVEDSADKGDAYVYRLSPSAPVTFKPALVGAECGALEKKMKLRFDIPLPEHYDFERDERSGETCENRVDMTLTLKEGSGRVDIDYELENNAKDHRLRVKLNLGEGELYTDSAFDYALQPHFRNSCITDSDTHCNATFCEIKGTNPFAVYTEGQHEVENDADGLYVTVLRSTGYINRCESNYMPTGGDRWKVDGNLMLGKVRGRMGLEFAPDATPADLFEKAKQFRVGALVHADSFDTKKYAGGRFVVQGGETNFYYVKDKYEGLTVKPVVKVDGDVCMTSFVEGAEGKILRLVNLSEGETAAGICYGGEMVKTDLKGEREKPLGSGRAKVNLSGKEIATILLK